MTPPDDAPANGEAVIRDIIDAAEELSASAAGPVPPMPPMPELIIQSGDLPATARELRAPRRDRKEPRKVAAPSDQLKQKHGAP